MLASGVSAIYGPGTTLQTAIDFIRLNSRPHTALLRA